jgi:hypothetical protein
MSMPRSRFLLEAGGSILNAGLAAKYSTGIRSKAKDKLRNDTRLPGLGISNSIERMNDFKSVTERMEPRPQQPVQTKERRGGYDGGLGG